MVNRTPASIPVTPLPSAPRFARTGGKGWWARESMNNMYECAQLDTLLSDLEDRDVVERKGTTYRLARGAVPGLADASGLAAMKENPYADFETIITEEALRGPRRRVADHREPDLRGTQLRLHGGGRSPPHRQNEPSLRSDTASRSTSHRAPLGRGPLECGRARARWKRCSRL